ncbi:hypothetical protein [Streptosporangium sp. NPDC049644]|uniref:hypothetical protein n=1 Tax=Streptosporangium sp. NPDC049644 TaxID=3155507 RepID=UPI0034305641
MLGISGGPRQLAPDRPLVQDQCRQVMPPTLHPRPSPPSLLWIGRPWSEELIAAAAERPNEITGVRMISAQELERLTIDHSSHSQPHPPITG